MNEEMTFAGTSSDSSNGRRAIIRFDGRDPQLVMRGNEETADE